MGLGNDRPLFVKWASLKVLVMRVTATQSVYSNRLQLLCQEGITLLFAYERYALFVRLRKAFEQKNKGLFM